MKKIILLILIFLMIGCSKKVELINDNLSSKGMENVIETVKYVDNNPIKISLYKKNNGIYQKQDKFLTNFPSLKDISIFSIILSDESEISGGNIKSLYKSYSSNYDNFSNYKIGYHIKINLKDNNNLSETILKPKSYVNYIFSEYLYIWFYDDINNSGWYPHIEEDQYSDNTVMSSIKLMATEKGNDIKSVELTVFTYDLDDFDEYNNYRGNSKFTTILERN